MHHRRKDWCSLVEASPFSGLPVHTLKEMIAEGRLQAERRGFMAISRGELIRLTEEFAGRSEAQAEYDLKAFDQD